MFRALEDLFYILWGFNPTPIRYPSYIKVDETRMECPYCLNNIMTLDKWLIWYCRGGLSCSRRISFPSDEFATPVFPQYIYLNPNEFI